MSWGSEWEPAKVITGIGAMPCLPLPQQHTWPWPREPSKVPGPPAVPKCSVAWQKATERGLAAATPSPVAALQSTTWRTQGWACE